MGRGHARSPPKRSTDNESALDCAAARTTALARRTILQLAPRIPPTVAYHSKRRDRSNTVTVMAQVRRLTETEMNSLNKKASRTAALVAILATVVTCGGTLTLADHYAHSGVAGQDYHSAAHQAAPVVSKKVG